MISPLRFLPASSVNSNFREENTRDCTKFVNYITEHLGKQNVNIVVGHTGDMLAYDYCNTNANGIKSIYDINRKNQDGSFKPCIHLPVSLCNAGSKSANIYKIDLLKYNKRLRSARNKKNIIR